MNIKMPGKKEIQKRMEDNMKKGTPKKDGSGKGTSANAGRGGCKNPKKPVKNK